MFGTAQRLGGQGFVGIGVFEQSQTELHAQHAAAAGIQDGGGQLAGVDEVFDAVLPHIVGEVVQLQVHARFQAQADGFLRGGGDEMPVVQAGNGGQVGAHKAFHAELAPQHVGEQFVVHGNGDAVDGVVAAHDVGSAAVHKGGLEHRQAVAEHIMAAHGAGGAVQPAHRVAVAHIVLGLGSHGVGVGEVPALQAEDRFPGKLGAQVGVLAVGFLPAAIAGVADEVHHRAVGFMDALGPGFGADGAAHLPPQFGVEGGGQADLLGEAGGLAGHQTMEGFLTEEERDAQAGLFHGVALHGVGLGGAHAPQLQAAGTVPAQQGVQAVHVQMGDQAVLVLGGKVAGIVLVGLQDLFPQSHAGEQVVDALFHRQIGVLIGKHGAILPVKSFRNGRRAVCGR